MEKYGVMKVLKCTGCDEVFTVRSNITDLEMDKLAVLKEGHLHTWKEVSDEDADQSTNIQP
jgi:hypothetical protein